MTSAALEKGVVDPSVDTSTLEGFEFEIVCDIESLQDEHGGTPICNGDPAKWVAWRANCCPQSPRFRLICDRCKKVYQNWVAHHASITCITCGEQTGGFIAYTPLEKSS